MSSKSPSQIKRGSLITITKNVRKLVAYSIPKIDANRMAGKTFEVDDICRGFAGGTYRCRGSNSGQSGSGWWVNRELIIAIKDAVEVEESIILQIRSRRDAGRKKYGTNMERKDLTLAQWLQHLQEELLDAAIYVEKLKREGGAK